MKTEPNSDGYRTITNAIVRLPFARLPVQGLMNLMVFSAHFAREFAESLRIARELHPEHIGLRQMAEGELATDNLQYEDYTRAGDHADFL